MVFDGEKRCLRLEIDRDLFCDSFWRRRDRLFDPNDVLKKEEQGEMIMIGILLVSHARLAHGMKTAIEFVAGEQENLFSLGLEEAGVA